MTDTQSVLRGNPSPGPATDGLARLKSGQRSAPFVLHPSPKTAVNVFCLLGFSSQQGQLYMHKIRLLEKKKKRKKKRVCKFHSLGNKPTNQQANKHINQPSTNKENRPEIDTERKTKDVSFLCARFSTVIFPSSAHWCVCVRVYVCVCVGGGGVL